MMNSKSRHSQVATIRVVTVRMLALIVLTCQAAAASETESLVVRTTDGKIHRLTNWDCGGLGYSTVPDFGVPRFFVQPTDGSPARVLPVASVKAISITGPQDETITNCVFTAHNGKRLTAAIENQAIIGEQDLGELGSGKQTIELKHISEVTFPTYTQTPAAQTPVWPKPSSPHIRATIMTQGKPVRVEWLGVAHLNVELTGAQWPARPTKESWSFDNNLTLNTQESEVALDLAAVRKVTFGKLHKEAFDPYLDAVVQLRSGTQVQGTILAERLGFVARDDFGGYYFFTCMDPYAGQFERWGRPEEMTIEDDTRK